MSINGWTIEKHPNGTYQVVQPDGIILGDDETGLSLHQAITGVLSYALADAAASATGGVFIVFGEWRNKSKAKVSTESKAVRAEIAHKFIGRY